MPNFGYYYYHLYLWSYVYRPGALAISVIESYYDPIFMGIIFLIYMLVLAFMVKMRESASGLSKSELRIFCVAVVSFLYESFFTCWSFWVPPLLPDQDMLMDISSNFFWILDCGLFALVMLVFNRNLRKKMLQLTRTSTVVVITQN
ncbi:hypothetical protein L596_021792 [Steinernema carpocapsae]|uniref:7TM GPCR serpentine receptor class x (Srx) domain-containing protein n=1 Tax=Steinernema carpocapsae TaxID=34508 RepID=A0A4U5MJW2_STECR|nr:hypothetical protein L596_021792 [Steinernema carpocapsae]